MHYKVNHAGSWVRISLRNLVPNATVILYSCSTGSGTDTGKNLTNTLGTMRRSITVIAPTDLLSTVEFGSAFPNDLILKNAAGDDITYCMR